MPRNRAAGAERGACRERPPAGMGHRPGSAADPRGRHHPLRPALSSVRVALVAQRASVEMHADGPLLLEAFDRLGIQASIVPWGSGAAWATFDAALVRSTWDYVFDRDGFLAWADDTAARTRLVNPAPVLRWNTDKRYLRDLSAAGVPIVPTVWAEPGDPV